MVAPSKLFDAVLVIAGVAMILFFRRLGEFQVRTQNQAWGFHMGPRAIRQSQAVVLVVGIGFVLFGINSLLGFIG
jgi:hypothetical protein